MSGRTREVWAGRYAWLGGAYLVLVSALHWSRGGPAVRDSGTASVGGALSDLLAFYGAWYAIGVLLLGLAWWRAAQRDAHREGSAR